MDFNKYGLTEEQIKALETEYNTEITKIKEEAVKPYADYETLKTNLNEANLKNTSYEKDIKSLTKNHEQLQEKYNNSLMDNAINMGLIEEGIKYPDLFACKIDRTSVKLEDGKVIGLKEQISTLKDKYADILNPTPSGKTPPPSGDPREPIDITQMSPEQIHKNWDKLFK